MTKPKFKFTAEHFNTNDLSPRWMAQLANAALDAHLATSRQAWIVIDPKAGVNTIHLAQPVDATHVCRLWDIEPVAPKVCEHLNFASFIDEGYVVKAVCSDCGARLKATWSSADE